MLRPACLSDVKWERWSLDATDGNFPHTVWLVENPRAIRDLYDAEWRKRGFERSP
jgi:hypothetical protein